MTKKEILQAIDKRLIELDKEYDKAALDIEDFQRKVRYYLQTDDTNIFVHRVDFFHGKLHDKIKRRDDIFIRVQEAMHIKDMCGKDEDEGMTLERAKELLDACIRYIKYDNDSTSEHLCDIIGFTNEELAELGYEYYGKEQEEEE